MRGYPTNSSGAGWERGTGRVRSRNKDSGTSEEDTPARGVDQGGKGSADIPDDGRRTVGVSTRCSDRRLGWMRR